MNKLIVAIGLIMCSASVSAYTDWMINGNSVAVSSMNGNDAIYHRSGNLGVSFRQDCEDDGSQDGLKANFIVNGTSVRMISECNGGSLKIAWYPETEKGLSYVVKQFFSNNVVYIDDKPFNAKGFTRVQSLMANKASGGI